LVESLLDKFAPNGVCSGCGPKNRYGLRLRRVPVTSGYIVRFLHPSPIDRKWQLSSRAMEEDGDRVNVSRELEVNGGVTATMTGPFVTVREFHPAFYR